MKLTLLRIQNALNDVQFDEIKLGKIVHVAGTNGKGSTSKFIADMLIASGYKTALFTSPHILKINERIVFNGKEIDDVSFNKVFNDNFHIIEKNKLSYFESLTFCAFLYFSSLNPDFSVIETGMGGRFDSSNVLNSKLPVITTIAKDHSAFLGENIYKIADEKLAIIKENPTVMLGINTKSLTNYIKDKLQNKNIITTETIGQKVPEPFNKNLALAENTVKELIGSLPKDFKPTLPQCRQESIGKFILDGAHNPNGISELMKSLKSKNIGSVIISSTADRDIGKLVSMLSMQFKNIIVTEIPDNDRTIRLPVPLTNTIQEKDLEKAMNIAIELAGNADILTCGSLYLCACIKKLLYNNK